MYGKIIWVGIRESEILSSNLFYKSITKYGTGGTNNISLNNQKEKYKTLSDFFISKMEKEIENDKTVEFYFYSNRISSLIKKKSPHLSKYIINRYNSKILDFIENKTLAHLWANNIMPVLDFIELFGIECTYKYISSKFPNKQKFVIQDNLSSGGMGTFLLTQENASGLDRNIEPFKNYIISPYLEQSFSVNVHMLISDNHISVLPPSIQIIENIDNRLLYKGADFIAYSNIESDIKGKIKHYSDKIGCSLYNLGYRGICGVDFLVSSENIFFMEINPRFQASSILINKALQDNFMPDLQTIVLNIWKNKCDVELLKRIENIEIKYSTLSFYQNKDTFYNIDLLKKIKKVSDYVEVIIEENLGTAIIDEYMYRVIFNTNIAGVNYDNKLVLYPNLLNASRNHVYSYLSDMMLLKCSLLTQGVTIHESIYTQLKSYKKIKVATFDAIDITIEGRYVINCPIKIKFVELSPFSIRCYKNESYLYFQENIVCKVQISLQEELPIKYTKNKINIHRIGYLTTDRLRIKHSSLCYFKRINRGCKFCHITTKYTDEIPLEDIYETIDTYINSVDFRHFLIGGPSNFPERESYYIGNIIQYIHSKSDKSIYIMSLPPQNPEILNRYLEFGATEVAFNIEIYNRSIAKKLMPGKGTIPLKQYDDALALASQLFGKENSRSMLLIGLDSKKSLLEGVEHLCRIGVTPMLSPFRPMLHTPLADVVPPDVNYVLDIFKSAKDICDKYDIKLGPKCKYCQNNTLTDFSII